jgi:hypothetical protein
MEKNRRADKIFKIDEREFRLEAEKYFNRKFNNWEEVKDVLFTDIDNMDLVKDKYIWKKYINFRTKHWHIMGGIEAYIRDILVDSYKIPGAEQYRLAASMVEPRELSEKYKEIGMKLAKGSVGDIGLFERYNWSVAFGIIGGNKNIVDSKIVTKEVCHFPAIIPDEGSIGVGAYLPKECYIDIEQDENDAQDILFSNGWNVVGRFFEGDDSNYFFGEFIAENYKKFPGLYVFGDYQFGGLYCSGEEALEDFIECYPPVQM